MFDYEALRLIWWGLIGVLLIGFVVTDGFDMGVGALLLIVGKTNTERRVMINSIAPHWDGNQVWLITAGGALFAAWPLVYATSFSSFYIAMYLVLIALWLRPLALEYRAKIDSAKWRIVCDIGISFSGIVPPVLFGVAFGNLMQGIPFSLNNLLMPSYHGTFIQLFNPFALLCGMVGLLMMILQGCAWLMIKTTDSLYKRACFIAQGSGLLLVVLFILGGVIVQNIDGYLIISNINTNGVSDPLVKEVVAIKGGWMLNFERYPVLWVAPIMGMLMPLLALLFVRLKYDALVFISSSISNTAIVLTAGFSMFPFIIPSSFNPNHSLTLWDSTSSELTLNIMTMVAFTMVPIIFCYTAWSYRAMLGRLDTKLVEKNSNSLY
ncbi:cytochrome d ubiquinol oxidase, subunit II [Aliivibrio wodanis]|uniref:Cytochrome d ubiquinol oxidase, subunit II n=1 Tax=Aliivibrio wodanis TaxID=80852 RepID=A0A090I8X0_9GAMM|nr:cytochrome d ubiquinol oxidase, subunit II [Aliivibrio wodanis]VVV06742.1 Cytochrome bd-I ubiquinol oxidase subunit 2 [Aliivibrio wodanis]